MIYTAYSLNGSWEMNYSDEAYQSVVNPWKNGTLIENAVPSYWEDMTDRFQRAPFFCKRKGKNCRRKFQYCSKR